MSKIMTLEVPDEIFTDFQKIAENQGKTAESIVLEMMTRFSNVSRRANKKADDDALKELMQFSGAVNSGNSRSSDNKQIDLDLAEESGKEL